MDRDKLARTAARPLDRAGTIALIGAIILTGFGAATAYHYTRGVSQDRPYPANTFLFRPEARFSDFTDVYRVFENPGLANDQPFYWNHFPFAYLTCLPSYCLFSKTTGTFVRLLLIAVPFWLVCRSALRGSQVSETWRNTVVFSVFTYPFLFALDRTNNEADIFLLLYWFVSLVHRGRYGLSILPLTFALAMKPYPAVFLPLIPLAKRWGAAPHFPSPAGRPSALLRRVASDLREPGLVVLGAIALNMIAVPILVRSVGYDPRVLPRAWKQTIELYVVGEAGLPFGHSLWGALKLLVYQLHAPTCSPEDLHAAVIAAAVSPYRTCVLGAFTALIACLWFVECPFWKKVTLLVCAMNLFPYVSADYKLLHVFIPMFLFINRDAYARADWLYAVLFAALLIPKNYHRFSIPGAIDTNLGVVLNPGIMLIMAGGIIGSIVIPRFRRDRPGSPAGPPLSSL